MSQLDDTAAAAATMLPDVAVLPDVDSARALLDPGRRRLLEALAEAPDSAAGLARRLGDSRQRLNYHLRALEGAGIVGLHEERRRGNCVERVLRVAARRFVVDPGALGELGADPGHVGDRFSATYQIALAARSIRELAALRERAEREGRRLATAALDAEVRLAGPERFDAFVRDLTDAVARVIARYHAAAGRPFRVMAALHPAPAPAASPPDAGPSDTAGRSEGRYDPGAQESGAPHPKGKGGRDA